MKIPKEIQREHVIAACKQLNGDRGDEFTRSTRYDVLVDGTPYPPKPVISLAAKINVFSYLLSWHTDCYILVVHQTETPHASYNLDSRLLGHGLQR